MWLKRRNGKRNRAADSRSLPDLLIEQIKTAGDKTNHLRHGMEYEKTWSQVIQLFHTAINRLNA